MSDNSKSKGKGIDEAGWKMLHSVVHPIRCKIIKALLKKPDQHTEELRKIIKVPRTTLSYHIGILQQFKLLESDYKVIAPPQSAAKMVKIYAINRDKLDESAKMLEALEGIFQED